MPIWRVSIVKMDILQEADSKMSYSNSSQFFKCLVLVVPLFGAPQRKTDVVSVLRARESGQQVSARDLKRMSLIAQLKEANDPKLFVEMVMAQADHRNVVDVYDKNIYMQVVPQAFVGKDQKFKNEVLDGALRHTSRRLVVAAITGGADPNHEIMIGAHKYLPMAQLFGQDHAYTAALLVRGADANKPLPSFPSDECLAPLQKANNLALAKLLIAHGANVHVRGHRSDTLLHMAAAAEHAEPELLRFYIETCKLDVHAENSWGYTPLENIVFGKNNGYSADRKRIKAKVSCLLEHGADGKRVRESIESILRYPSHVHPRDADTQVRKHDWYAMVDRMIDELTQTQS